VILAEIGTGEVGLTVSGLLAVLWTISWFSWKERGRKQDELKAELTAAEVRRLETARTDAEKFGALQRDLTREISDLNRHVAVMHEQSCDARLKVQEALSASVALQLQSLSESSKRVEAQLARMDRHRRATDDKDEGNG